MFRLQANSVLASIRASTGLGMTRHSLVIPRTPSKTLSGGIAPILSLRFDAIPPVEPSEEALGMTLYSPQGEAIPTMEPSGVGLGMTNHSYFPKLSRCLTIGPHG
jgi:hypothetical protein